MSPIEYVPTAPGDFVGPARKVAALLETKAKAITASGMPAKVLLFGSPGIGKTALANMFAARVAGHPCQIESVNGRNVTVETIRRWTEGGHYRALYGGFTVKIVNELDTCPAAAQDLLLSYLDELPKFNALIGTCNANLSQLSERFQTRLQQFNLKSPVPADIEPLLSRFGLNGHAVKLAITCAGNVRSALLDAQSILDAAAIA